MKRAKIVTAILCLILNIVICIAVCKQWAAVGCGVGSLIIAIIFYTVGAWGLYILIDQIIEWIYWLDKQDKYPDNPSMR